jgi:hypothetical protein
MEMLGRIPFQTGGLLAELRQVPSVMRGNQPKL